MRRGGRSRFDSGIDQIEVPNARPDFVFADGALRAAAWLKGKQGVVTMRDVLGLTDA